ncbi:MAG: hypothetical protein ACLUP5_07045 [Streptococcus sp.]
MSLGLSEELDSFVSLLDSSVFELDVSELADLLVLGFSLCFDEVDVWTVLTGLFSVLGASPVISPAFPITAKQAKTIAHFLPAFQILPFTQHFSISF